jgi:hypothetical protein
MIDLNNLHGGTKLIKQIVEKNVNKKQPWSREQQRAKAATHKNVKPKSK